MSTMLETIACIAPNWNSKGIDEGWLYLPGYKRPSVQKWDPDPKRRFKTDKEALEHVMTSDSEPCRECRNQLMRDLFL